jgi:hypothetical protein
MAKIFWNEQAEPINMSLARVLYGIRTEDPDDMMLDSVVEADFYEDADEIIALDALIVPFRRLETKMLAMRRVMERNATNLTVADMQTTKPFKKNGVTQIVTIFELSDGQTISIFFHNPDTTPAKIAPTDELISWKWLLNKKDVTILVAPEQGKDLNVNDVCRRLLKIAEKNAPAFARANAKKAERMANIETAEKEIESLSGELKKLESDLEAQELTISDLEAAIALAKATPTKEQINQAFEEAVAKTKEIAGIKALNLAPKFEKLFITKSGAPVAGLYMETTQKGVLVSIGTDKAKVEVYGWSSKPNAEYTSRGYAVFKGHDNADTGDHAQTVAEVKMTNEQMEAFFAAIGSKWQPEYTPKEEQAAAPAPKQGDSASLQAVIQYLDLGKEAKALFFNEDRSARELSLTAQTGVMIQIASDLGSVQINAFSGVNGDVGAGKRGYFVYQGNEEAVVESGSLRIEDVKAIYNVLGAQWNPQEAPAAEPAAVAVIESLGLTGKSKEIFYEGNTVKATTKIWNKRPSEILITNDDGSLFVFGFSARADALPEDRQYTVSDKNGKVVEDKPLSVEKMREVFAAAGQEWRPKVKAEDGDAWRLESSGFQINKAGIDTFDGSGFYVPVSIDVSIFYNDRKLNTVKREYGLSCNAAGEILEYSPENDKGDGKWGLTLQSMYEDKNGGKRTTEFNEFTEKEIAKHAAEIKAAVIEKQQAAQQKYVDDHFTFVGAGADAMAEALGLGKAAVSKPATIAKPVEDTPNPSTEHLDPQDPQYDRKRADSIWLENLKADKVSESPSEIDEMLEGMFEKYENDPSMSPLVDEAALAYSKRVIQKSRDVLAKVGG